jgi:hypothetical protein
MIIIWGDGKFKKEIKTSRSSQVTPPVCARIVFTYRFSLI